MSVKSGRPEVYVTQFPGRGTEQQVSTAGGGWPRWNRSGKELFYLALDNTLMVTPVNTQTSHIDVGTGRPLFPIHPRPARRLASGGTGPVGPYATAHAPGRW